MRRKSKLKLVRDTGKAAVPISTLSADEQVRLLSLADVALQNKKPDEKPIAETRVHREHQRLRQDLKDTLDRLQKERTREKPGAA